MKAVVRSWWEHKNVFEETLLSWGKLKLCRCA